MEENASLETAPAAEPPPADGVPSPGHEGLTLACGACRRVSPAGLPACPACGRGLRTGTAALLAVVAALAGLATLGIHGVEMGTTEASVLRPAFFALTGAAGLLGAWSVWNGRRAGWLGLHLLWAAQLLVPLAYAILMKRAVAQTLLRDPTDFLAVKLPILAGLVAAWMPATRAFCSAPSNLMTLFRRELGSFLYFPLAYVILFAFLLIVGILFYANVAQAPDFDLDDGLGQIFGAIFTFLVFCAPILTMRLVAEEKKTGTIEVLMTAPVTDYQVVMAKFLSVLAYFGLMMVPTFSYVYILARYSLATPDYGLVVGGYLGLFFLASAYFAIGLFISSMTRNQIVAAVVAFVCFLALWILPWFGEIQAKSDWLRAVVEHTHIAKHNTLFGRGIVDSRAVIYDASLTVLFLFLSVRVLEGRRWA